ncbi:hypothetical protein E9531_17275 [Lampropedia puyangensis]|uniref:Uncharacterized protein n=1 Tax=Lampropedia puyangensis TaxID=1330072 RepID=A0A4S8EP91_9BURK|nr:hypothetical protein [Lampropedia puyangensis]THT95314.1 hypothetical protein E9531_17275 [Lampropedia puyangensis]
MKRFIVGYLLIGVLLMPFIYWNNANGSRPAPATSLFGATLTASLLFWPSYLFSIEPELDGDSDEAFADSIQELVTYRRTKWFAGSSSSSRRSESIGMIGNALNACMRLFDKEKRVDFTDPMQLMRSTTNSDPYFKNLRRQVREHLDGEDFSGLVAEGNKCNKNRR